MLRAQAPGPRGAIAGRWCSSLVASPTCPWRPLFPFFDELLHGGPSRARASLPGASSDGRYGPSAASRVSVADLAEVLEARSLADRGLDELLLAQATDAAARDAASGIDRDRCPAPQSHTPPPLSRLVGRRARTRLRCRAPRLTDFRCSQRPSSGVRPDVPLCAPEGLRCLFGRHVNGDGGVILRNSAYAVTFRSERAGDNGQLIDECAEPSSGRGLRLLFTRRGGPGAPPGARRPARRRR